MTPKDHRLFGLFCPLLRTRTNDHRQPHCALLQHSHAHSHTHVRVAWQVPCMPLMLPPEAAAAAVGAALLWMLSVQMQMSVQMLLVQL